MNITSLYAEVAPLLDHDVQSFCRRRPQAPHDELRAEADFSFLKAARSYRPERGTFRSWLRGRVWRDLQRFEQVRQQQRRLPQHRTVNQELDQEPARRSFTLGSWLQELSEDAQLAAQAALALNPQGPRKRQVVMTYLQELGWGAQRILESFTEIKDALC